MTHTSHDDLLLFSYEVTAPRHRLDVIMRDILPATHASIRFKPRLHAFSVIGSDKTPPVLHRLTNFHTATATSLASLTLPCAYNTVFPSHGHITGIVA